MKKFLLIFGLILMGLSTYAQSGQDFPSFGNEVLSTANKIRIYPNPSVDYINITIDNSELENVSLVIHNIIGSRFELKSEEISENSFRIDVQSLPAGYYLLSIKDPGADFSQTFKFLKR
jgi:hypothetical protein